MSFKKVRWIQRVVIQSYLLSRIIQEQFILENELTARCLLGKWEKEQTCQFMCLFFQPFSFALSNHCDASLGIHDLKIIKIKESTQYIYTFITARMLTRLSWQAIIFEWCTTYPFDCHLISFIADHWKLSARKDIFLFSKLNLFPCAH